LKVIFIYHVRRLPVKRENDYFRPTIPDTCRNLRDPSRATSGKCAKLLCKVSPHTEGQIRTDAPEEREGSMKRAIISRGLWSLVHVAVLVLLLVPLNASAQTEQAKPAPPPVSQPLVREGEFALKLEFELGAGVSEDEAEAESALADLGIMPRNGWIADYPVTPDIVGELQRSVLAAVDAGKLSFDRDEAMKRFTKATADLNLSVSPYTGDKAGAGQPPAAANYPDPTVVNNYYYEQGPPVVTYYAPPPDYYYLYSWVPYPFWWYSFWFPGFFVLNDFHRTVFVRDRVFFVSNHFNDRRVHRVFRIDPVTRFHGRTFAGIGAAGRRGFISTGVPRGERTIFNGSRTRSAPGMRSVAPPPRGSRAVAPSQRHGGTGVAPSRVQRGAPAPQRGGQMRSPPSRGGEMRGQGGGRSSQGSGRGSQGGGRER
jgi:hypothetical protein